MDNVISTKQYTVQEIEDLFATKSMTLYHVEGTTKKCVLHQGMEIFELQDNLFYLYHYYMKEMQGGWKVTKTTTLAELVEAINKHHFNSYHHYMILNPTLD